jgi:hypothetical protein
LASFTQEHYAEGVPAGMEFHYWNFARNMYLSHLLKSCVDKDEVILEIGCGRGIVVEYLRAQGLNCFGSEIANAPVPDKLKKCIFSPQDATTLPADFREGVRIVLLLDVIEHIEDAGVFLAQIRRSFPNMRKLIVMVPARKEIWSNFDSYYGHHRRYDPALLMEHLSEGGFSPEPCGYFFHILYWVMRVLLPFKPERPVILSAPSALMRPIHYFFAKMFLLEGVLLPRHWLGSSLLTMASPGKDED